MKTRIKYPAASFVLSAALGAAVFSPSVAFAQMMGGFGSDIDWNEVVAHTLREEAEGKALWERLQVKEVACTDLADHDFGTLGEYFMGLMLGDAHAGMNAMMIQMHGEDGEEQIHVAMGKRLSGCDASAGFSAAEQGWMPMMQWMGWRGLGQAAPIWGGSGGWLVSLLLVVWSAAGLLAIVWLWKHIAKK